MDHQVGKMDLDCNPLLAVGNTREAILDDSEWVT